MHSTKELRSDTFSIALNGAPATIADVFPGFDELDRIGVVVHDDFGAVGASTLILAAVTAFFDIQRSKDTDFFAYPDYFLFHTDRPRGDHAMLDIYRAHKEVVVGDDPQSILEAVNDRGITRLIVTDDPGETPNLLPDTRSSATRRIRTVLAYAPGGRVEDADITVIGNEITEGYVEAVLDPLTRAAATRPRNPGLADEIIARSTEVDPLVGPLIKSHRKNLLQDGRPMETFRRLSLDEGLRRLTRAATT